jgi:peptidoglycan/LPS O-acetylase OafA/YrhL
MSDKASLPRDQNNYDLLRLIAAILVLWFHQNLLLGRPTGLYLPLLLPVHSDNNVGILGVFIFFAISGYLNTRSILRSRSTFVFLANRCLRIYPALLICILVSACIGALFADTRSYFTMGLASWCVKNSLLFFGYRTEVNGAFELNAVPRVINGSLWTLPYEVKLYLALALTLGVSRFNSWTPPLLLIFAATVFVLLGAPVEINWWWQFVILFLGGSSIAAIESLYGLTTAIVATLVIGALTIVSGNYSFILGILITSLTVASGTIRLPRILHPRADLSYGIYLYGYPVQQALAIYTDNFWLSFFMSLCATAILAAISWRFIEQRARNLNMATTRSLA